LNDAKLRVILFISLFLYFHCLFVIQKPHKGQKIKLQRNSYTYVLIKNYGKQLFIYIMKVNVKYHSLKKLQSTQNNKVVVSFQQ